MFTLVIVGFALSALCAFCLVAATFISVAFGDPEKLRQRQTQTEVKNALDKVAQVKVDTTDPSSPTYGELVEQGAFKHWLGPKRGVS